jgi:hypothetical protein
MRIRQRWTRLRSLVCEQGENKMEKNRPEKVISTGAIQVAVWKNESVSKDGNKGEFRTIVIQRRYADKNGEWKSTSSLRVNDLPKVVLALNKAFESLVLKGQDSEFIEEVVV